MKHSEDIVETIGEEKPAIKTPGSRHQAAVVELGRMALTTTDLDVLHTLTCETVARTLGVEYSAFWELLPNGRSLLLKAGLGWQLSRPRHAVVSTGANSFAGYVLSTSEPVIFDNLEAETRFRASLLLHDHGIQSGIGVAVRGREEPIGVIAALFTDRRSFARDDMYFLESVANILATATERRRTERTLRANLDENQIAREIQERLFPRSPPGLSGFDIAGAAHAALATGGDYFDYLPLPDHRLGIVIGDVSGHGFGPALLMAETRACLWSFAQMHSDASQILGLTNRVLVNDMGDRFVTMLFLVLDPAARSFTYSSAGHPTCYVVRPDGQVSRRLDSTGPPLGVMPASVFRSSGPIPLETGDLVLLFTDGLVEGRDPELTGFGPQRALDIVRVHRNDSAQLIVDNLYWAVRAFTQADNPDDDMTAVVIKVTEG